MLIKELNKKIDFKHHTIPWRYHVVFWSCYFLFNFIRWGSYFQDYSYSFKSNLVEFFLHIIIGYFNIYYLLPKYIIQKKYFQYTMLFTFAMACLYFIRTGLNYFLVTENIWPEAGDNHEAFTMNHIVAVVLGEIYVVALVTAIKISYDWSTEKSRLDKLQKEHLKTELDLLKSQIQPHFFFNTLNNLYALTLIKSDDASEVIVKLSEIMRYVLYEVNSDLVAIKDEFKYLKNYIDLEKLRHQNIKVSIDCFDDVENIKVPPLLFFTYTENSFKHGGSSDDDFYIKIEFKKVNENTLSFSIENNYIKEDDKKNTSNGIGIINSQRRLDLLYKNNYVLNFNTSDNIYKVYLEIPI